jgi:hypothetical protein
LKKDKPFASEPFTLLRALDNASPALRNCLQEPLDASPPESGGEWTKEKLKAHFMKKVDVVFSFYQLDERFAHLTSHAAITHKTAQANHWKLLSQLLLVDFLSGFQLVKSDKLRKKYGQKKRGRKPGSYTRVQRDGLTQAVDEYRIRNTKNGKAPSVTSACEWLRKQKGPWKDKKISSIRNSYNFEKKNKHIIGGWLSELMAGARNADQ